MKTADFDFTLPESFIAQSPSIPRDHCKLLVYDTKMDLVLHKHFYDLPSFLRAGDAVVLNTSRVFPARIVFLCDGAEREIFLLERVAKNVYSCLVKPGKFFSKGRIFSLPNGLIGRVVDVLDDGRRVLAFSADFDVSELLRGLGRTPFPPYIKDAEGYASYYQTVYSNVEGSVAAPTAGLHFTHDLLKKMRACGVIFADVLLHVGLGTFMPVKSENLPDHKMHEEFFELDERNCILLNDAKASGGKVFAVGTTAVRVLESCSDGSAVIFPRSGGTDIFIYPGYEWHFVDALVTNFHLPKSTLLMLVASFFESKGVPDPVEKLLSIYELAKQSDYRFYSFGDAMLII